MSSRHTLPHAIPLVEHRVEASRCFGSENAQPVGFGCDRTFRGEEDTVEEILGGFAHGTLFIRGEGYQFVGRAVCPQVTGVFPDFLVFDDVEACAWVDSLGRQPLTSLRVFRLGRTGGSRTDLFR